MQLEADVLTGRIVKTKTIKYTVVQIMASAVNKIKQGESVAAWAGALL